MHPFSGLKQQGEGWRPVYLWSGAHRRWVLTERDQEVIICIEW